MYIKNPILAQKDENLYFIGSHDDIFPLQKNFSTTFHFLPRASKPSQPTRQPDPRHPYNAKY